MLLSWSPAYCASNLTSKAPQCVEENYFVNYGLVPFRPAGEPERDEDCVEWRLTDDDSDRWLWIIPNRDRINKLWRSHGACSGLEPDAYLSALDRANRRIVVPPRFDHVSERIDIQASELRRAFVEVNPGLSEDAVDLICKGSRLYEVNICFDRDFGYRRCEAVRECGENLRMEPIRPSRFGVKPRRL